MSRKDWMERVVLGAVNNSRCGCARPAPSLLPVSVQVEPTLTIGLRCEQNCNKIRQMIANFETGEITWRTKYEEPDKAWVIDAKGVGGDF